MFLECCKIDWFLGTKNKVFDPKTERTGQRMLPEIPKSNSIAIAEVVNGSNWHGKP